MWRLGYKLDIEEVVARFKARARELFLHQIFQTASMAQQASYSVNSGTFYRGIKRLGCETDHSFIHNAEIKNVWSYTSMLYVFMTCTEETSLPGLQNSLKTSSTKIRLLEDNIWRRHPFVLSIQFSI